jgi:putative transposase
MTPTAWRGWNWSRSCSGWGWLKCVRSATVRHRTKVTRGPGTRAAGLAMAFKLIEAAQGRWRAVNAPHLVALVRAGAVSRDGVLIERPEAAA